jgi:hypothetical protein
MISNPKNLFAGHTKEFSSFPDFTTKMLKFAEGEGYRREMISTISDPFGRQVIELYRFRKKEPASPETQRRREEP